MHGSMRCEMDRMQRECREEELGIKRRREGEGESQ